jgi:hypothetical protein
VSAVVTVLMVTAFMGVAPSLPRSGVGGAALVTGQLPSPPVVFLAAGGACGAVADGGLSTLGQGPGNSRRK